MLMRLCEGIWVQSCVPLAQSINASDEPQRYLTSFLMIISMKQGTCTGSKGLHSVSFSLPENHISCGVQGFRIEFSLQVLHKGLRLTLCTETA